MNEAIYAASLRFDDGSGNVRDTLRVGFALISVVGSEEDLDDDPNNLTAPVLAVDVDARYTLGYLGTDPSDPTVRGVYVRRFSQPAHALGDAVRLGAVLPSGGNGAHSLALDVAPGGGLVASFVQTVGATDTIYAATLDAAGAPDPSGYVPIATDAAPSGPGDGRFVPGLETDARGFAIVNYAMRSVAEVRHRQLADHVMAERRGATLFVNGTGGDDHIIVERVRNNLFVNVNGVVRRLDANVVQSLSIDGFGGDDDVINATALPATIHGRDGADTLWGGIGDDSLRGFGGNDVLFGDTGNDTFHGGDGADTIHGGAGGDSGDVDGLDDVLAVETLS